MPDDFRLVQGPPGKLRVRGAVMIPVYVLNLSATDERYLRIESAIKAHDFLALTRVQAVDGRFLPDACCFPLTRNKWSVNHKGTLACFLGHVRAWELIAASEHELSLFIEDDVRLFNLETIEKLVIPDGVDLVFCNDRTCYAEYSDDRLVPVGPVLDYVLSHGQAVGGDGYFLTRNGAKRLLSFVQGDGFFSHVDLRLLAYSLGQDFAVAAKQPEHQLKANIRALRTTYDAAHFLRTFVLNPFIVKHLGGLGSRRESADIKILLE